MCVVYSRGYKLPLHKVSHRIFTTIPWGLKELLLSLHPFYISWNGGSKRVTRKRCNQDQYPNLLTKPSEEPSALNLTSRTNMLVVTQVHRGIFCVSYLMVYLVVAHNLPKLSPKVWAFRLLPDSSLYTEPFCKHTAIIYFKNQSVPLYSWLRAHTRSKRPLCTKVTF